MLEIKEDKLNRWLDSVERRHEARIRNVIEVTDQEVMEQLGKEETENPDEEALYKYFCQKTPQVFYTLTGFTREEFDRLWAHVSEPFTCPSRGRKGKIAGRDILLILLHYIRRYPRIEEMASIFSFKPSTLQGVITKYIPLMAEALRDAFITPIENADVPYDQKFPECGYVVDATVQEICKPNLDYNIAKQYYSGKHGIYCLKSQVVVNVKGLALHIVTGVNGAMHDKALFDKTKDELIAIMKKHPNQPHKILADKGYQDSSSDILVTPHKGNTADLTREQLMFNQKLGEVRIIVENFFGRLKARYEIMSDTFRGAHETYSAIFVICCALVNFEQIENDHPLRENDGKFYYKLKALVNQKREEKEARKKEKRKQQAKLRKRIFSLVGEEISSSDESESS